MERNQESPRLSRVSSWADGSLAVFKRIRCFLRHIRILLYIVTYSHVECSAFNGAQHVIG